jgi:FAD/FMN-containing dehydrogenase
VVWVETVEDVQKVLKIANEYEVPINPVGGRTSSSDSEGIKGCIAMDFTRMNKVVELNEKTMRFVAEAGIRISDALDYVDKRGYMILEYPTMNKTSLLGSRASLHGYNKFENRWGSSGAHIKGIEVVIPNGDAMWLGKGTSLHTKSVMGLNLMDLFIGSRGTLGVITKVAERMIRKPKAYKYGLMGFKTFKDGIEAYIELRQAASFRGPVWRTKSYNKWLLRQAVDSIMGQTWPEEVEQCTDFHVLGDPDVVDAAEKICWDILKAHGGFWKDEYPPPTFVGRMHETMEKYMGMASIGTDRVKTGGRGQRIIPYDANIPDGNLIEFYGENLEHWHKIEDPKVYPNVSKYVRVLSPGAPVPTDEGYCKNWALQLGSYVPAWTEEARGEYCDWFKKYAEICWKYGGSLTATHGYVPRALELEILKKELGENYYKLMCQIKDTIDPKHIMNPKTKFRFGEGLTYLKGK